MIFFSFQELQFFFTSVVYLFYFVITNIRFKEYVKYSIYLFISFLDNVSETHSYLHISFKFKILKKEHSYSGFKSLKYNYKNYP